MDLRARRRCSRRVGLVVGRDRVGLVGRCRGVRRRARRVGMGMDMGPGMDTRRSRMRKGGGNAYTPHLSPARSISLVVYYALRSSRPVFCLSRLFIRAHD